VHRALYPLRLRGHCCVDWAWGERGYKRCLGGRSDTECEVVERGADTISGPDVGDDVVVGAS
jgi:hypothetical protein